jgi:RNA polymerase sigma-70 factor (ECF subfamily)
MSEAELEEMNRRVQANKESEIIAAILAGNAQLYHQLILPYERSVYTMSLSYMKTVEDAEEVAQATFVKAFRNLCTFRGDWKFGPWLISIAVDEAKIRLRQQATSEIASLEEPECQQVPVSPEPLRDWRELPSSVVEREDVMRFLQQAIAMLPGIYQRVFLLRDVEGLDVNDTSKILAIDSSLVKLTLHRARIMLQNLLAPSLKTLDTVPKKMQPKKDPNVNML